MLKGSEYIERTINKKTVTLTAVGSGIHDKCFISDSLFPMLTLLENFETN